MEPCRLQEDSLSERIRLIGPARKNASNHGRFFLLLAMCLLFFLLTPLATQFCLV